MATDAAWFEPRRLLFAPAPKDDNGRGRPWRPRRRSPPLGSHPRRDEPHARPAGAKLARIVLIAIAAMLLLIGPLLSPAMAADLFGVHNGGAATLSFVPSDEPDLTTLYAGALLPDSIT